MKYLYLFVLFFSGITLQAQNEFITTWQVTSSDLSITIPTNGSGYNYTVNFGDGTILNNQQGDVSHTYNQNGTYTVSISGNFPRINFQGVANSKKIMSIEQWGNIQWQSMQAAFNGCINLVINATDAPDLSQVTDMSGMFSLCTSLNQPINHWDVSTITNMNSLFNGASSFNQPLDSWDVSNVTKMAYTFASANSFNQPLGSWDVSNVNNMKWMFVSTFSFNQPLDNWDVSTVTTMEKMFGFSSFNSPIDNWNVSSVTNMGFMFQSSDFNQSLNSWDVSNVSDMDLMFAQSPFNQPLDNWDVSNVSTMFSIFFNAQDFNQDLSSWNFHPNVNFHEMFYSSGLDVDNYDKLLAHLTTFGYTNKTMIAKNLKYCDITSRDFLTNNLNWSITNDELAQNCNVSAEESILDAFTPTPNPTMGMIHLDLQNIHIEEILLYNTIGQRIKTFPYVDKIDISEFHSGLYFLQLRTQETQKTYPIVKN
ncbi:BspA family leucine-rich repeat surface protein [Mesonia sp. K7]|uniref:BspA family leucine-rich repeat surface protein n=1 Tax=Mesonia sp. K7 TaxID=2218606 RepID=UPI000DA8B1B7|nr:BspA family leucine-rich repeat surface protein [Mesonia sp. K7]PZD77925.1 hypothetical protein DNG35_07480 [Mesonia sp. K7]